MVAGRAGSGAVRSGAGAADSTERTRAAEAGAGGIWPRTLAAASSFRLRLRWPVGRGRPAESSRAGRSGPDGSGSPRPSSSFAQCVWSGSVTRRSDAGGGGRFRRLTAAPLVALVVAALGASLSEAAEAAEPGTPMTASFTQAPAAHDGSNGFDLHMEFSHEPNSFSYRTVHGARCAVRPRGRTHRARVAARAREEPPVGHHGRPGRTGPRDAGRARDDRLRRTACRVRRRRAEVRGRSAPDGSRTAHAPHGFDCAVDIAGIMCVRTACGR